MSSVVHAKLADLALTLPPFEGVNVDKSCLILAQGHTSAESAILEFRSRYSTERTKLFRRYYFEPVMMAGRATGRYRVKYVWNTERPDSDVTVGLIGGEDLAEAKVLIGNSLANTLLTGISWHLCEDRAGQEVIEVGRFDVFDLLQDVSREDLERLAKRGRVPEVERWDFDCMYLHQRCPSCYTPTSINGFAFSIDSARCATCGVRPFLSAALNRHLPSLVSVTGVGENVLSVDAKVSALLHTVGWMGGVGASARELSFDALPAGMTPHDLFKGLLADTSEALFLTDKSVERRRTEGAERTPPGIALMVSGAQGALAEVIERGGPFTAMHAAAAEFLQSLRQSS